MVVLTLFHSSRPFRYTSSRHRLAKGEWNDAVYFWSFVALICTTFMLCDVMIMAIIVIICLGNIQYTSIPFGLFGPWSLGRMLKLTHLRCTYTQKCVCFICKNQINEKQKIKWFGSLLNAFIPSAALNC